MHTASAVTCTVCEYNPAIYCYTGLCGPRVDSHLPQVARDLRRFEIKGVRVTPGRFAPGRDRTIWLGDQCESREKWYEASLLVVRTRPELPYIQQIRLQLASRTWLVP